MDERRQALGDVAQCHIRYIGAGQFEHLQVAQPRLGIGEAGPRILRRRDNVPHGTVIQTAHKAQVEYLQWWAQTRVQPQHRANLRSLNAQVLQCGQSCDQPRQLPLGQTRPVEYQMLGLAPYDGHQQAGGQFVVGTAHALPQFRIDRHRRPGFAHQRTGDQCLLRQILEYGQQRGRIERIVIDAAVCGGRIEIGRSDDVRRLLQRFRGRRQNLIGQLGALRLFAPCQTAGVILGRCTIDGAVVLAAANAAILTLAPFHVQLLAAARAAGHHRFIRVLTIVVGILDFDRFLRTDGRRLCTLAWFHIHRGHIVVMVVVDAIGVVAVCRMLFNGSGRIAANGHATDVGGFDAGTEMAWLRGENMKTFD